MTTPNALGGPTRSQTRVDLTMLTNPSIRKPKKTAPVELDAAGPGSHTVPVCNLSRSDGLLLGECHESFQLSADWCSGVQRVAFRDVVLPTSPTGIASPPPSTKRKTAAGLRSATASHSRGPAKSTIAGNASRGGLTKRGTAQRLLPQPEGMSRKPLPITLPDRSAPALHDVPSVLRARPSSCSWAYKSCTISEAQKSIKLRVNL
jgi:hypothetical protein